MRENVLALVGLLLLGAGVWLAFGLAATLSYAGVALLGLAVALALMPSGQGSGQ